MPKAHSPGVYLHGWTREVDRSSLPVLVTLAFALTLTLTLAGCGNSTALRGTAVTPPQSVAKVSVTNVSKDPSQPFPLVAPKGGLLLVYLGYTSCPDLCPTTMSDLRSARNALGADASHVEIAFVSVDPTRDTPDVLRNYLSSFGFAPPTGVALRPTKDELTSAQLAFHSSSEITNDDSGKTIVSHMTSIYAIDASGSLVDVWSYGTPPKDITHDLRILLKRA